MSNADDFAAKKTDAEALPEDQVLTPYIPVGIYLQEAEDLFHWCQTDKDQFLAAGVAEQTINDIPVLAGGTREAQSIWMKNVKTKEEAEREWAEKAPEAFNFRDQLLHTFRYAYRNDPDIMSQIQQIAEGNGSADLIQDLNDLAVIVREYPSPIVAIGEGPELGNRSATLSDEMADLRARANGEKIQESEHKQLRDRFYTLLKQAVDEVRTCGKYLFWRQPDRLKGYNSKYLKQNFNN